MGKKIIKKKVVEDVIDNETGVIEEKEVETYVEAGEPNTEVMQRVLAYVTDLYKLSDDYVVTNFSNKGKKAVIEVTDGIHTMKATLADLYALGILQPLD